MLAGCASSKEGRGNLSGAMNKASDKHTGSRDVAPATTTYTPIDVHVEVPREERREQEEHHEHREHLRDQERQNDSSFAIVDTSKVFSDTIVVPDSAQQTAQNNIPVSTAAEDLFPKPVPWVSLSGGSGLVDQTTYYGLSNATLRIGVNVDESTRIEFEGWVGWSPIQTTSQLSHSIDGITILGAGIRGSWYLTPPYTFLGVYLFGGAGYNYMMWSYKNALTSEGSTINNDAIDGVDLYAGVGVNIVQTKNFQLGFEARPGVGVWIGPTSQGFDNDVFSPLWYVKFGPVLNFSW